VVHAAPDNLWRAPLANATDEELVDTYSCLQKRLVVYGHIHHGFVRSLTSHIVANCGSVSLSYDGDPRASYAIVDDGEIVLRRVAYDIDQEITRLKQSNYPFADWLATILKTGTYVKPPT
jgi:diadenosine tetraphosphatase ApaH/serine/threonine PP2A family protein phosphatase